jgi:hypothetical protein
MGSRKTVAVAAAAFLTLAACGGGGGGGDDAGDAGAAQETPETAAPEEVTLTLDDSGYQAGGTLEAEPVTITVTNETDAPHMTFFARLNDGVTQAQIEKSMKKGPDAIFPLITVAGGAPETEPGGTSSVTVDLPEGTYLVIDPEADGPPPVGFFEVTAATGPEVEAPEADWSIEAGDFYFETTDPVSGPSLVEISNEGEQGHEVILAKAPAKSRKDEVGFYLAPPPGGRMWVEIDLEPGDYKLLCFFPDPKTEKPHVKLGMERDFSVE